MKRGLFISIEGPDGSGKSTQIAYLKQFFDEKGIPCIFTREPGGTAIGEKLREIILDRENREMCAMTEALLYAASRAQHVEELIKPALNAGQIVVCDRFVDSSIAYQGFGRNLGDSVRIINEQAVGDFLPDVTFLMKLAPEIGKSRIAGDIQDRLEQEKMDFHRRVYEGYQQLAEIYPQRFVQIDAGRGKEDIRKEILFYVERFLEGSELCR